MAVGWYTVASSPMPTMKAMNAGTMTTRSPLRSNSLPVNGRVTNVAMAYTTKKKLAGVSSPFSAANGVRNASRLE